MSNWPSPRGIRGRLERLVDDSKRESPLPSGRAALEREATALGGGCPEADTRKRYRYENTHTRSEKLKPLTSPAETDSGSG